MGGDGPHPALIGGARHHHHGELGAVESLGDIGGHGDGLKGVGHVGGREASSGSDGLGGRVGNRLDRRVVPVVEDGDAARLGDRFEVGPEVIQVGQGGVTAVAGHVGSHSQRPSAATRQPEVLRRFR